MLTLSENHSQKLGYFGFYCKAVIFTKFIVLTRVRLPSVNIIFCFFIIYFFFICKCFFFNCYSKGFGNCNYGALGIALLPRIKPFFGYRHTLPKQNHLKESLF